MKRLILSLLCALPLSAQFATYDAANYGINLKNLNEAIQMYRQFQAYQELFQNASAFLRNPAAFLAAASNVVTATDVVLQQNGSLSAARAAQLQTILRMGQVSMTEAQMAQALSHGNSQAIGQMIIQMAQTGEQLAQAQKQVAAETRVDYYRSRDVYQPQGSVISDWRLK